MKHKNVYIKEITWPEFGEATPILTPSAAELQGRIDKCREMMKQRKLSHLVVYGDREHFGNIMYLSHFDPRFEEALLIIGEKDAPLILVGNECVGHLSVSPLYNEGGLRHALYQPFSLISQPREKSVDLVSLLKMTGINEKAKVGCIGWKYYNSNEFPNANHMIEIPSFIVDTLRSICGYDQVENASDILMSPVYGLKSVLSPFEIAHFEFVNVMASQGMKRLLLNFRADVPDFELLREYQYTGYPLGCHMSIKSSGNQHFGLSSPVGALIKRGEPCSTGIAYWGTNSCRAGWVAEDENDLPEKAQGYVEQFAGPYFSACCQWLEHLKIGVKGKKMWKLISDLLPFEDFHVYLNPGHLIHYEEWLSSPIYEDSEDEIRSGMYMMVDIIPRSEKYFSSRMEDGIVIADEALREQLKELYPEVYDRCIQRQKFMRKALGINLPDEVLPLSNMPAIVPPFFLNPKKVLSLKP